jgi:predicted transcriptional regulator
MNSLKIQLKDEKEKANIKLQNTILQNERQVSEITAKRKEAEQKYHEIFEKYKNLIESQATLIENHKTSVLSLKIARERIEEMENKMRKMDSEMYVLGKRAAVQFEELTPRPNFKQVGAVVYKYCKNPESFLERCATILT